MVITVVGGAQDFTLTPQLQSTFSSGLASAAMSSRARVLTGGTNTGVMKMVGKAMQEQAPKVPSPPSSSLTASSRTLLALCPESYALWS